MAHEIAVLAFPGISPFHLAVPSAVFASPALEASPYRVRVCAETPGPMPSSAGYDISVKHGLSVLRKADTIVLPSWDIEREPSPALLAALAAAHRRGARMVGLCLGSFLVAACGVADGREVATHWHAATRLRERYPSTSVRDDVLWVDHGDVITSAGVTTALDCCLHLVRHDLGAAAAANVARRLVLAPHRDGSQAQFIPTPLSDATETDPIAHSRQWALSRLDQPITLDDWSRVAAMSRRTFTRQFRDRTGTSPQQWLLEQRLTHARVLLESTTHTVDRVATAVGFATAASLRQHFAERYGTTPARHRAAFAG
jgi:transcriptional regulator GlxA family with amidase domain